MGKYRPAINILLVDDQPEQLLFYRAGLKRSGFSVVTAGCAEDALVKVSLLPIHVVLSDIQMPRRDGFWLLDSVRRCRPRVLFCFMSGAADLYRARGIYCGAVAVFSKPLDVREFCAFSDCFL